MESQLLDYYFASLIAQIENKVEKKKVSIDKTKLEEEWRELYPVAWADFHRFLAGWSPGHWKIHDYSNRMTKVVLRSL